MKLRTRRYVTLLLISVAIRIFFYFFPFENTPFKKVAQTHILYDTIFFAVLISLLNFLKDRKWIIGLAWIMMANCIAANVLIWIGNDQTHLTLRLLGQLDAIVGFVNMLFYVCIFFTRKSPARVFFRCMTAVMVLPFMIGIFALIFQFGDPAAIFDNRAFDCSMSVLLNILLILAILRTAKKHQPEYADFLA